MKNKILFAVLGTVIILASVLAVIFFTKNTSDRPDPVEEAMKSLAVYTEEGFMLYLSEDGSYYTFGGARNFEGTDLVIPAYYNGITIKIIANGAFLVNRQNFQSISIPETVTEINASMSFGNMEEYPLEFNEYKHGYYLGNEKNPYHALMFYDQNYGKQAQVHPDAKVIAQCAFKECKMLTSVKLPEGLLGIGTHAFLRCTALKQAEIPDSVTDIGQYIFSSCDNLEAVTLGSGITEISDRMFNDCASLTRVEFRGKITRIGESAFSMAISLKDFEIPATVTEIGDNAFNNPYNKIGSLTNVIIHKGVQTIAITAFPETVDYNEYHGGLYLGDSENPYLYLVGIKDNEAATLVLHPDTYSVVQQLIPKTNTLKSLSVEGGNGKYLYSDGNCIIRKEDKTLLCGIGTSIIPSTGITEIAPYAFAYSNLESVLIPDSVKKIGEYAFCGCASLSSAELGKNLTEIERSAFVECESLEKISIPSVYEIPPYCFSGCELLSEVTLTEETEIIGDSAFNGCNSLVSISLPGVKVIKVHAFNSCDMLERVSFSEDLGYIDYYAFNSCKALKNIILPYGLRYLGSYAFQNCDSLKYLNVPKSIEKFGNGVYSQCASIEYAIIPEGVESITAHEFELCTSLKKISLPSTLKRISGYAVFGMCESIEEIVFAGTVEQWNAIEKSDSWYIATPACKVICTNGEVELPADESKYVGSGDDWTCE